MRAAEGFTAEKAVEKWLIAIACATGWFTAEKAVEKHSSDT